MVRKRVYVILLILMSISFIGYNNRINDAKAISSFQKLELRPFDISWSVYDNPANMTAFEVITNITIYNPNSFPVQLTFPTTVIQMIGTNATFDLDSEISAYMTSICGSFEQVIEYRTIPSGSTTNTSKGILYLGEENLTALVDGRYYFDYYLYALNTTLFTSNQVLLTIQDGIPSINFNYGATIAISIQKLYPIFLTSFFTVFVICVRKQAKSKSS